MCEWALVKTDPQEDDLEHSYFLSREKNFYIGRTKIIDIVCTSPLASRQHGYVLISDDCVFIRDTNSANGIYVNDNKIEPDILVQIHDKDIIGIGAPTTADEPNANFFRLQKFLPNEKLTYDQLSCDLENHNDERVPDINQHKVPNVLNREPEQAESPKRRRKNTDNVRNDKDLNSEYNKTAYIPNHFNERTIDSTLNDDSNRTTPDEIHHRVPDSSTILKETHIQPKIQNNFRNTLPKQSENQNEFKINADNNTNLDPASFPTSEQKLSNHFPTEIKNEPIEKLTQNTPESNQVLYGIVPMQTSESNNRSCNSSGLKGYSEPEHKLSECSLNIKKEPQSQIPENIDIAPKICDNINKLHIKQEPISQNAEPSTSKCMSNSNLVSDSKTDLSQNLQSLSINNGAVEIKQEINEYDKGKSEKLCVIEIIDSDDDLGEGDKIKQERQNNENTPNKTTNIKMEYSPLLISSDDEIYPENIKSKTTEIIPKQEFPQPEQFEDPPMESRITIRTTEDINNQINKSNLISIDSDDDEFPPSQLFDDDQPKRDETEGKSPKEEPRDDEYDGLFAVIKREGTYQLNDTPICIDDDDSDDDQCVNSWFNKLSQSQGAYFATTDKIINTSQLDEEVEQERTSIEQERTSIEQERTSIEQERTSIEQDENQKVSDKDSKKSSQDEQDQIFNEEPIDKRKTKTPRYKKVNKIKRRRRIIDDSSDEENRELAEFKKLHNIDSIQVLAAPPISFASDLGNEIEPEPGTSSDTKKKTKTIEKKKKESSKKPEKNHLNKKLTDLFGEEKSPKPKKENRKYTVPPIIEAPFLRKGPRKAHEPTVTKIVVEKKKELKRKLTNEVPTPVPAKKAATTPSAKVIENEFKKRTKSKPRRSDSTNSRGTDIQKQIKEDRKKRLKELAEIKTVKETNVEKVITKPKVKVSSGRGLFLTEEAEHEPPPKKKFVIPKKRDTTEERAGGIKLIDIFGPEEPAVHSKPAKIRRQNSIKSNDGDRRSKSYEVDNYKPQRISLTNQMNGNKKRVTFSANLQEVRVYEIEHGNKLLSCKSLKDAPLPNSVQKPQQVKDQQNGPNEEDALFQVLNWVPKWLEEQKNQEVAPKVSTYRPMQMLLTFNTIGDYYHIVAPLLHLELWNSVFKDWSYCRKAAICADIVDVRTITGVKNTFTTFTCNGYLTKREIDTNISPRIGDLIILEFMLNNEKNDVVEKFGFVMHSYKRKLPNRKAFEGHRLLKNKKELPESSITFTVHMKPIFEQIKRERPCRVRVVSYISPCMRLFKSVAQLRTSPLCDYVLKPNIQNFKIPKFGEIKFTIMDRMDPDQLRTVKEAIHIASRPEPGIYMIQGPPGTGKSYVIVNIVRQLLFGERRQRNCILICAPSNGAIDEITLRLLDLRSKLDKSSRFKMLRLGPPNSIHPRVRDISIQNLIIKRVKETTENIIQDNDLLKVDLNFRESKINTLQNTLVSLQASGRDTALVEKQLQKAKNDLQLFYSRKTTEMTIEERIKQERKAEIDLIEHADIICTTLSSSSGSRMEELCNSKKLRFSCCIVDEATQSNEQETLMPLLLGISRLILVGDPAQLPATVISQEAKNLGFGLSLFSRIQSCLEHLPENPIRMLRTQYRMHAEICRFPNERFYANKLRTPPNLPRENCIFHPYRIFSLSCKSIGHEDMYINYTEANFVLLVANIILENSKMNVGIITPYSKQKAYIIAKFQDMMKGMKCPRIDVNTVDGFQGQERDVIIFSPVRFVSNGFLNDYQRINVSFTRARFALIICAQERLFQTEQIWSQIEKDGQQRRCIFKINDSNVENREFISNLLTKKLA